MHERRRDPRTSKPYSLQNLLKLRAESGAFMLAVVGTADGFIMASSRDRADKQGARLAAHASTELFRGKSHESFSRTAANWPDVRCLGLKLEIGGRDAFIAALVPSNKPFCLEELATCVRRILTEPARVAA
jgi:hypothetical protein